jgi:hypothetical protein
MTRAVLLLLLPALAAALGACAKSEAPPPEPAPAVTPTAAPLPSPAATPALPSAGAEAAGSLDLPTEEDFEDESAQAINGDNLEAQLDALEKEIQDE